MIIWDLFSGDNTVHVLYIDFALVSAPLPPVRVRSLRFISIDAPDGQSPSSHREGSGQ